MAVLVTGGARSGKSRFAESYAARLAARGIYVATAQAFDDEMAERIQEHREDRGRSGFAWETVEEPLDLAGLLDRLGAETDGADLWTDVGSVRSDRAEEHPEVATAQADVGEQPEAAMVQPNGVAVQTDDFGMQPDVVSVQSDVAAILPSNDTDKQIAAVDALPNLTSIPDSPAGSPVILIDCLTLWLSNHLLAISPDGGMDRARVERELDARIEALADAVRRFPHPLVLVTNEVGGGIVPETPLGRLFRDAAGRMNQRLAGICDRVFLVVSGIPVDLKEIAYRMDDIH